MQRRKDGLLLYGGGGLTSWWLNPLNGGPVGPLNMLYVEYSVKNVLGKLGWMFGISGY